MSDNKYYGWNLPFSMIGVGAGIAVGIALEDIAVGVAVGAGLAFMFGMIKRNKNGSKKSDEDQNT